MAITDEHTVLILGAGASVPFGLPLGGGLIDDIANSIYRRRDSDRTVYESEWHSPHTLYRELSRNKQSTNFPPHPTELDKLYIRLTNQTSETIDDFIVQNPSLAEITKACIAGQFAKCLYKPLRRQTYGHELEFSNPLAARNLPVLVKKGPQKKLIQIRNWVHLLINIIRQGLRLRKVNSENKIVIITFNYDTILEYILDEQFNNTEYLQGHDWKKYIEVLHPHGQIGTINQRTDDPVKMILDWAAGIHVVNENNVPSEVQANRNKAKKYIELAKEIYSVGFAFSSPNCRLLGLDDLYTFARYGSRSNRRYDTDIFYCNYDGNIGLKKVVEKYGWQSLPAYKLDREKSFSINIDPISGSLDNPIDISNWMKLGVLGEAPG